MFMRGTVRRFAAEGRELRTCVIASLLLSVVVGSRLRADFIAADRGSGPAQVQYTGAAVAAQWAAAKLRPSAPGTADHGVDPSVGVAAAAVGERAPSTPR